MRSITNPLCIIFSHFAAPVIRLPQPAPRSASFSPALHVVRHTKVEANVIKVLLAEGFSLSGKGDADNKHFEVGRHARAAPRMAAATSASIRKKHVANAGSAGADAAGLDTTKARAPRKKAPVGSRKAAEV